MAPSLWRQLRLSLCEAAAHKIEAVFGSNRSPECFLLADVLNVLGRPLGVGQGNYPTCQSTRALSMWAYSMPAELLQILAWAARDDEVVMHFEDNSISLNSDNNCRTGARVLLPRPRATANSMAKPRCR